MTPRDRRALIVGGVAVVAALILLRAAPWTVRQVLALRARATDMAVTLARARKVIEEVPAVRDSLAPALSAIVALGPKVLDGRSRADAEAALADLVTFTAQRQRLRIVRLDPVADTGDRVFGRVAVHAELEGDVAGLTRFLQSVETGEPVLTVPALTVQALEPDARPGVPERLRIEAVVSGLYLPREGR